MSNLTIAIPNERQDAVTLDCLTFFKVEKLTPRRKEQREFALIMRLRMAVLLSVFKRADDELLDDPRVEARLNELLASVREHTPSLSFHNKYTRRASELAPGIFLKVNFACTEAALFREKRDNVVYLEVSHD